MGVDTSAEKVSRRGFGKGDFGGRVAGGWTADQKSQSWRGRSTQIVVSGILKEFLQGFVRFSLVSWAVLSPTPSPQAWILCLSSVRANYCTPPL